VRRRIYDVHTKGGYGPEVFEGFPFLRHVPVQAICGLEHRVPAVDRQLPLFRSNLRFFVILPHIPVDDRLELRARDEGRTACKEIFKCCL